MKKILITLLFLALPMSSGLAADLPDEQMNIIENVWDNLRTQAELFDDLDPWSASPSQIQILAEDPAAAFPRKSVLCSSTKDPNCRAATELGVRAYLPTCIKSEDLYCVEEFFAVKDGVRINGTFKQQYPIERVKGYFEAEPKYELPAGGSANLWELPGIIHAGGTNQFLVNAQLFGGLRRSNVQSKYGNMEIYQVWSSISAVQEISYPGARAMNASDLGGGDGRNGVDRYSKSAKCIATSFDHCLIAWPLDESISLGITLRTPHTFSGWLHGRLNHPDIKTSRTSDGFFHITFAGSPTKVPTVFASIPWSDVSAAMKKRFGSSPSGSYHDGDKGSAMVTAGRYQSSEQMVEDLNLWLPVIKDKATATPTYWIVRTIAGGDGKGCFKDGRVNGIVTTNATAYISGAPFFNEKYQSLDYKVASPHYDANGRVNVGNYNLQINSDVARCLYGFTSAPIGATVSVISSNGENQVATTTLKEKDGWIYLTAAGFTYSSPTVRVKLSQKSTTACTRGASAKKTSATSAKCSATPKKK
ncbi:MAG: hypothetical protein ACKOVI_01400 [Candidatus Planktophila sp.]